MKLPGLVLSIGIVCILVAGCTTQSSGPQVTSPETAQPTTFSFPEVSLATTPATFSVPAPGMPLITPGPVDLSIRAAPARYNPLMSSTVGIGLTPQYTGSGPVVYGWNASYGHFIGWNASDGKVTPHNASVDTTDPTIYWSYSPDDMGKEKPPVTIRLIVKTPPRAHGGNGTIAWKDLHISWEKTDTAVVAT
jgi:hypothetical protein